MRARAAVGLVLGCLVWGQGLQAQAIRMPGPPAGARRPELVELIRLDTSLHLDIRYATARNFLGRQMYRQARAFLQRPAAEALVRAHRRLRAQGYGLLVHDGYRPWRVTKAFWIESPPAQRRYVADPRIGSLHNRGCAVDVSLYHLRTGKPAEMPTDYDDLTPRAHVGWAGASKTGARHAALLCEAMAAEGFRVNPDEWWHFDHPGYRLYAVLDMPFDSIPIPK
jgi:zinc D-Ala-D-Ala dipeptidase